MYEYELQLDFDTWCGDDNEDMDTFLERRKRVNEWLTPRLKKFEQREGERIGNRYLPNEQTCRAAAPPAAGDAGGARRPRRLCQAPRKQPLDQAEWFIVWPGFEDLPIDSKADGTICMKGDRVKGRKPLRHYSDWLFLGEKFVTFLEKNGVTGLDTLSCPDTGKYAAPQWWVPVPTSFVGRGVDHPWFDPTTRGQFKEEGYLEVQPTDPKWKIGVRKSALAQSRPIHTGLTALDALFEALREFEPNYRITLSTPHRLLRAHLPETDFAYLRVAAPFEREAQRLDSVRLCCSATMRETLVNERLALPTDFVGLEVVDGPGDSPVFDDQPPPPYAWDVKERARREEAVERMREKLAKKPKPERPVTPLPISKLVPKIKRVVKRQTGEKAAKGATVEQLDAVEAKIGRKLPTRWRELLTAINGFDIDNSDALDGTAELRISDTEHLADVNEGNHEMAELLELRDSHIGVGDNDLGDPIFLAAGDGDGDDCPVIHVDHETSEIVMTWPAIGLFLADAVETGSE